MAPFFALMAVLLVGATGVPASPAASGMPQRPLRTIAHIYAVTAFCKAFQTHFNGAVEPLLTSDEQLGYVHYTMGRIESDFRDRAYEQRLYTDRVDLIAYLKTLFAGIEPAQNEINALRDTAKTAPDPQTTKTMLELASQLQRALDKQHQLALDSLGVVHAMTDVSTGTNLSWISRPFNDAPGAATPVATPISPEGYDPETQHMPQAQRDVRNVIAFDKQLGRINDAENGAARNADTIAAGC